MVLWLLAHNVSFPISNERMYSQSLIKKILKAYFDSLEKRLKGSSSRKNSLETVYLIRLLNLSLYSNVKCFSIQVMTSFSDEYLWSNCNLFIRWIITKTKYIPFVIREMKVKKCKFFSFFLVQKFSWFIKENKKEKKKKNNKYDYILKTWIHWPWFLKLHFTIIETVLKKKKFENDMHWNICIWYVYISK